MRRSGAESIGWMTLCLMGCASSGSLQSVSEAVAPPQESRLEPGDIPDVLQGGSRGFHKMDLRTGDGPEASLSYAVHATSMTVRMVVRFKASEWAPTKRVGVTETVSYYPLAVASSWLNPRVFYVAGRTVTHRPILEEWVVGDLAMKPDIPLEHQPDLSPPVIERRELPVDPALPFIHDIAPEVLVVNGVAVEGLLALEHGGGDLVRLDLTHGTRRLRVEGSSFPHCYRTVHTQRHSDPAYGMCTLLRCQPPNAEHTSWLRSVKMDPTLDPGLSIYYDPNQDGTYDGSFHIPTGEQRTHELYATGSWTQPWSP